MDNELTHESDVNFIEFDVKLNLVYIQRYKDKKKIEDFSDEVSVIAEVQPEADEIVVGDMYLAQFTSDNDWYRAVVLSREGDKFTVQFIDYGNKDVITTSRLRICPSSLNVNEVPPLAFACRLWNITPYPGSQWCNEAISTFMGLCENSTKMGVHVYSLEENPDSDFFHPAKIYLVDFKFIPCFIGVSDDSLISVREAFLFLEYGKSFVHTEAQQEVTTPSSFGNRLYYTPVVLFSSPISVIPLNCVSPSKFTVKLKSSSKALGSLVSEMHDCYDHLNDKTLPGWKIYAPKIGMLCAVNTSNNLKWLRAQIASVMAKSLVKVVYIDEGKEDIVHVSLLRKLPDTFLNVPAQAINCCLSYVSPLESEDNEWTRESIKLFKKILKSHKNLSVCFNKCFREIFEVSIMAEYDQVVQDVASLLINRDLAAPSESIVNIGRVDYDRLPMAEIIENNIVLAGSVTRSTKASRSYKVPEALSKLSELTVEDASVVEKVKSQYHSVQIIQVHSPSLIHARFTSLNKKFREFQEYLCQKVKNLKRDSSKFEPSLGSICLVDFKNRPPHFARAKVIEETSNGYKVLLIDCGGITEVPRKSISSIPSHLLSSTSLAFAVCLTDIQPPCAMETWPSTSTEFLKEQIENNPDIYMIKKNPSFKDPALGNLKILPVEMGFIRSIGVEPFKPPASVYLSFKSLLLNEGLALPTKMKMKENQNLGKNQSSSSDCTLLANVQNELTDLNTTDSSDFGAKLQTPSKENGFSLDATSNEQSDGGEGPDCGAVALEEATPPDPHPPQPPLPETFKALVTNVAEGGLICLQNVSNQAILNQMALVHSIHCQKSDLSDDDLCWQVGGYVVAKFHLDNNWYRAKVLKIMKDGQVQVEFVDYGNVEMVPLEFIRNVNLFPEIPMQCYKCVLHRIVPRDSISGWTVETLDILHSLVVMNTYNVTVISSKPNEYPQITLKPLDKNEIDVCDILVNKIRICDYKEEEIEEPDIVVLSEE